MKFLKSRGMRKLARNRMALASMAVIAVYLLASLVIALGAVTMDETLVRVGPDSVPGFTGSQNTEKRLQDADWHLARVEGALTRSNVEEALEGLTLAERTIADVSHEELESRVEAGVALYLEIVSFEPLEENPRLEEQLAELESIADSLYAPGGTAYALRMCMGTDRQGRSIAARAFFSIIVAIKVGTIVALVSVLFGSLLGAAAGYFGGWVDGLVIWLYSTLSSIPNLLLLLVLSVIFRASTITIGYWTFPLEVFGQPIEDTLWPLYISMCATFWVGPCRVIRGETLKLKELEYVQAATSIGFGRFYILVKHVIPNTAHLMFINFSLLFIGAVKSEVILSFLGLGVQKGPSWGIMISQSSWEVVNNFFWQIGSATALMVGLVLAFNILSDALQDAFDPKHVG